MWIITEHKKLKGQQELKVSSILKEMGQYSQSSYAEAFKNEFELEVKKIKRTNNFSADLLYKVKPINQKSVEVWKMTAKGDFGSKFFTLDYVGKEDINNFLNTKN